VQRLFLAQAADDLIEAAFPLRNRQLML